MTAVATRPAPDRLDDYRREDIKIRRARLALSWTPADASPEEKRQAVERARAELGRAW